MAYFGLRKPFIASYNKETGTYSGGFQCGKAIKVSVTPKYVEGSLYADDEQDEYEKVFQNANVSLNTNTLPIKAANTMYGHEIDEESREVIYKSTDEPNYVGTGFVVSQTVSGIKSYVATIITCAKFTESAEEYTTKGESITYVTPTQEGLAIPDKNSRWKDQKTFDTAEEAVRYIKAYLNMAEYVEVTPVGTENPSEEGWYERSGAEGSYVYTLTADTTVDSEKTYYRMV